jgi:uncharacterized protein YhbP (UPF0306 family)
MTATLENIRLVHADGTPIRSDVPSPGRVQGSVVDIFEQTGLCARATVTANTQAHVNIGYFAYSGDLRLYLLSHPSSLHCRNVAANPSMAVAAFTSPQNWTNPGRGVQLFGTCRAAVDDGARDAENVYRRRYPSYDGWRGALKVGDPALEYRFYEFVPGRLKILDEAEFGDAVFVEAAIVRT